MKIRTNEFGKAEYWENTFVAHASGWTNFIDLYFAPETAQTLTVDRVYVGFNPRTRTGCDCRSSTQSGKSQKFQSTHPHGVRLFKRRKQPMII